MPTGNPSADDLVNNLRKEMGVGKPPKEGQKPVAKAREIGPEDVRNAWLALEGIAREPGLYSSKEFRKRNELTEDRQLNQEEKARTKEAVAKILLDDANRVVDKRKEHTRLKEKYAGLEQEFPESRTGIVYSYNHEIPTCVRDMRDCHESIIRAKERLKMCLGAVETLGFTEEEIPELKAHRELVEESESDKEYEFKPMGMGEHIDLERSRQKKDLK